MSRVARCRPVTAQSVQDDRSTGRHDQNEARDSLAIKRRTLVLRIRRPAQPCTALRRNDPQRLYAEIGLRHRKRCGDAAESKHAVPRTHRERIDCDSPGRWTESLGELANTDLTYAFRVVREPLPILEHGSGDLNLHRRLDKPAIELALHTVHRFF
jgi:hypothetical protein